ncbi:MAG: ABC transporter ATP-binding protein [Planctomycetota bacterium]|jgi:ABC-type multidrug transport system fused ATPase/permease subunit
MSDFWYFARKMLRYPTALITGGVFAILAAAGLGIGLASLLPIMQMMLGGEARRSLVDIANDYNAGAPIIEVPADFVAMLPTDPAHGIALIIGSLCVLAVFGAMATFGHAYLSLIVATRTVTRVRQQAFHHVISMPLGRIVERGPTEFIARVVRDAAELQQGFLALTSKSVVQGTRGISCLLVAIVVCWEITVIAPVVGFIFVQILHKFGKRVRQGTKGSLEAQERLLRIATESVQGLRAVKANTAERQATWRFHTENRQVLKQELRARIARAMSSPISELLATFLVSGLAIYFTQRIMSGTRSFEQFVTALAALAGAGASFKPLAGFYAEMQAASAPAGRLREIIKEPRENARGALRPALPLHRTSIECDSIRFTYAGGERPAIDDVSLRIEHGERVAIVGPNGCGKTTLVSMLPRLLRPSAGRILIDGVDIESVSLRSLRRQIGVVTQETVLFRSSIAENISLGAPGATPEQIERAARQAHAHEFIMELPGGYHADVAEQGASLSGGQRQRLAIARAIIRDPSILILDEATSQIDAESEKQIDSAIQSFCVGRTSLLIAHRFATVLNADRIVVMDEGRIIDIGRHEELLDRCDVYQRLTESQLLG